MDIDFNKNRLAPGDDDYIYEVSQSFNPEESNEWDQSQGGLTNNSSFIKNKLGTLASHWSPNTNVNIQQEANKNQIDNDQESQVTNSMGDSRPLTIVNAKADSEKKLNLVQEKYTDKKVKDLIEESWESQENNDNDNGNENVFDNYDIKNPNFDVNLDELDNNNNNGDNKEAEMVEKESNDYNDDPVVHAVKDSDNVKNDQIVQVKEKTESEASSMNINLNFDDPDENSNIDNFDITSGRVVEGEIEENDEYNEINNHDNNDSKNLEGHHNYSPNGPSDEEGGLDNYEEHYDTQEENFDNDGYEENDHCQEEQYENEKQLDDDNEQGREESSDGDEEHYNYNREVEIEYDQDSLLQSDPNDEQLNNDTDNNDWDDEVKSKSPLEQSNKSQLKDSELNSQTPDKIGMPNEPKGKEDQNSYKIRVDNKSAKENQKEKESEIIITESDGLNADLEEDEMDDIGEEEEDFDYYENERHRSDNTISKQSAKRRNGEIDDSVGYDDSKNSNEMLFLTANRNSKDSLHSNENSQRKHNKSSIIEDDGDALDLEEVNDLNNFEGEDDDFEVDFDEDFNDDLDDDF